MLFDVGTSLTGVGEVVGKLVGVLNVSSVINTFSPVLLLRKAKKATSPIKITIMTTNTISAKPFWFSFTKNILPYLY